MWDTHEDYVAWQNQVKLANYVGPLNPPGYYEEIEPLPCGCSPEDTDGFGCGHWDINYPATEEPEDHWDWLGTTPERESELQTWR